MINIHALILIEELDVLYYNVAYQTIINNFMTVNRSILIVINTQKFLPGEEFGFFLLNDLQITPLPSKKSVQNCLLWLQQIRFFDFFYYIILTKFP